MTKKLTPTVEIELDKKRPMALDLNAMVTFEDITGESFFDAMSKMQTMMSAKIVRALLYACLSSGDEDIEIVPSDVGRMITAENIPYVTEKILELATLSMPQTEAKGEGKNESRSTG